MAPKYKYEIGDKVWLVEQQLMGIIVNLENNKYDIEYEYLEIWCDADDEPVIKLINCGRGLFMAHELLPYTEGMELLYE